MKQYSNMTTSANLRRRPMSKYNSVTDSNPISADDLGVNITKSVFGWKTAASGVKAPNGADMGTNTAASAWIDQYGLPFVFAIGGNQIILPPIVQAGGTPVPPLPDGLTVVWGTSFMNVAIPPGFLTPVAAGGRLTIYPGEMPNAQSLYPSMSSRAAGSWTNNLLISGGDTSQPNQGETLLRLIMAVMECLIYSYSSYPWGNDYNSLSGAIMTKRNLANFLNNPDNKNTLLGNVLNAVTPIYTKYIAPVLGVAANAVAPGVGTAIVAGSAVALTAADKATTAANAEAPQDINAAETTQEVPTGTLLSDQGGQVVATSSGTDLGSLLSNPIVIIAIIVLLFLIL